MEFETLDFSLYHVLHAYKPATKALRSIESKASGVHPRGDNSTPYQTELVHCIEAFLPASMLQRSWKLTKNNHFIITDKGNQPSTGKLSKRSHRGYIVGYRASHRTHHANPPNNHTILCLVTSSISHYEP